MNRTPILRWLAAFLLPAPFAAALALPQQPAGPPATPPATPPAASPSQDKPEDAAPRLPEAIAVPLPQGTRLCLKDGNYLMAREYKVKNGRVSYWSVERGAWEEIPESLVDWDATHRAEAEEVERKKHIDEKLEEIKEHERAVSLTVDTSVEAAPGIFLPDDPGFYILANGAIASLSQDLADSQLSKKHLLLKLITPIPIVPTRHNVELKGEHAKLRIRDGQPEFFFRTADKREPAIALVRARVHGGSRLIAEINAHITGDIQTKTADMSLERWVIASGTFRYTLGQKLDPGEYAFIENVPEQGMDLYIWDFGVDPPVGAQRKK